MNCLKLSLCLLIWHSLAHADEIICRAECPEPPPVTQNYEKLRKIAIGSVVYHIGPVKVARTMFSPQVGIEYRTLMAEEYESIKWFAGTNSVRGAMGGASMSWGARVKAFSVGLLGGVYLQDVRKFHDQGIDIMGLPIGSSLGLAPLVGLETAYNFGKFELHSLLSPAMAIVYFSLPI